MKIVEKGNVLRKEEETEWFQSVKTNIPWRKIWIKPREGKRSKEPEELNYKRKFSYIKKNFYEV